MEKNGNALFLILIAVALFAALSYAVTQSGRGGGSVDRETNAINAAQFVQYMGQIITTTNKLYLIGGYNQVFASAAAETSSGTCYSGQTSYGSCYSIGVFNTDMTLDLNIMEKGIIASPPDNTRMIWGSNRVQVGGSELGSTAPDETLTIYYMSDEFCQEINNRLHGSTAIPTLANLGDAQGAGIVTTLADGSSAASTLTPSGFNVPFDRGCATDTTYNYYFDIIKIY